MKRVLGIIAVLAVCSVAALAQAADIQIKGSDTLINMVQKLAEDYMNANPGSSIAVTGGGSGTGISALINKKCDIANASREMKSSEIETAVKGGVNPQCIVVAIDGLSVIAHPKNMVKELTVDQIGGILRGDIKSWKEVGGEDMPITLDAQSIWHVRVLHGIGSQRRLFAQDE